MSTPPPAAHPAPAHGHDDGAVHAHVVPKRLLLGVYVALVILTIATVAVTRFDFGSLNVWVALGIAVIKGALVALFFMHLLWDNRFNAIILISALLFVAIFIAATITDSGEYKVNYTPPANSLAANQP